MHLRLRSALLASVSIGALTAFSPIAHAQWASTGDMNATLSNNNTTLTTTGASGNNVEDAGAFTAQGYSSGLHFIQVQVNSGSPNLAIGLSPSTNAIGQGIGSEPYAPQEGVGLYPNYGVQANGAWVGHGQSIYSSQGAGPANAGGTLWSYTTNPNGNAAAGDIITFAVNYDTGRVWIQTPEMIAAGTPWNNSATDNPLTGSGGVPFDPRVVGVTQYIQASANESGASLSILPPTGTIATQLAAAGFSAWGGGSSTPTATPAPASAPVTTPTPAQTTTPSHAPATGSISNISQAASPDCYGGYPAAQSSIATIPGQVSTSITDGSGGVWTMSPTASLLLNGQPAGYSQNVVQTASVGGTIYQQNVDGFWWSWNGTTWVYAASVPAITSSTPTIVSEITAPTAFSTTNASGQAVKLQCGQLFVNGVAQGAPYTATQLSATPQSSLAVTSAAATKPAPVATQPAQTPPPVTDLGPGACVNGVPNYAASAGGFGTINGQIYAPDGTPFKAAGINVDVEQLVPDFNAITSQFPGLNFIRVPIYSYQDPSTYAAAVNLYASKGIVLEFEDHISSTGANAGGNDNSGNTIFTGQQLTNELNWFSSMGAYYKNNPYVWFGTDNEPAEMNSATGQDDPAALSAWQQATYNAVRNSGNNNPIMLEANCWGTSCNVGYNASAYSNMTNVVWDMHYYNIADAGGTTDQGAMSAQIATLAQSAQKITSQDGTVPIIIGEFGNATGQNPDPGGTQAVNAVLGSGYGSAAFVYGTGWPGDGLIDGNGNLTAYGQQVAGSIATSGAPGCAVSPVVSTAPATVAPPNPTTSTTETAPALASASAINTAPPLNAAPMTVDQVAAMATGG